MAQTLVVVTAGIDLSLGMIFVLTNCLASWLVADRRPKRRSCRRGAGCRPCLRNGQWPHRHLWKAAADRHDHCHRGHLFRHRAAAATGSRRRGPDLADALTGKLFDRVPASLVALLAVVLLIWILFRRSLTGRAAYATGSSEAAAYMSGVPIAELASSPTASLVCSRGLAGCSHLLHLFR